MADAERWWAKRMMRMIGSALVLLASTLLGFQVARSYRDRPKQISKLIEAIGMLRTEIEFNLTPLPEALTRVAEKSAKPFNGMFTTIAHSLSDGVSVREAFHGAIEGTRADSALQSGDFLVVEDFALTLGTSDLLHQRQQLDNCLTRLQSLGNQADAERQKNERMWQFLGVLFGLFVVVVLY